jgi:hypothetical protein
MKRFWGARGSGKGNNVTTERRPMTETKIVRFPQSQFTKERNNIFDKAGITLKQARVLELLFLYPTHMLTYGELGKILNTSNNAIGRIVFALKKKGMVAREISDGGGVFMEDRDFENPIPCDQWDVMLDSEAGDLRERFRAWDQWLTENEESVKTEMAPYLIQKHRKFLLEHFKVREDVERIRASTRNTHQPDPAATPKPEPAHWCVVLPVKERTAT